MSAEELLVQVLTSDTTLSPLLGTRVYDAYAGQIDPSTSYPYMCYKVDSRQCLKTLAGNSGTYRAEYTLTTYALRSSDVRAIQRRLYKMTGPRTESGGGVTLRWLWVETESSDAEYTGEQDSQAVRESNIDVTLWYDEV